MNKKYKKYNLRLKTHSTNTTCDCPLHCIYVEHFYAYEIF